MRAHASSSPPARTCVCLVPVASIWSKGLTVQAWIWPTTPTKPGGQAIIAAQPGFVFGLDADGRLRLELGAASCTARVALDRWRWAFVAASYDGKHNTCVCTRPQAEPYSAHELASARGPARVGVIFGARQTETC